MHLKIFRINSAQMRMCPLNAKEDIFDNIHTISKYFKDLLCAVHIKAVNCLLRTPYIV